MLYMLALKFGIDRYVVWQVADKVAKGEVNYPFAYC